MCLCRFRPRGGIIPRVLASAEMSLNRFHSMSAPLARAGGCGGDRRSCVAGSGPTSQGKARRCRTPVGQTGFDAEVPGTASGQRRRRCAKWESRGRLLRGCSRRLTFHDRSSPQGTFTAARLGPARLGPARRERDLPVGRPVARSVCEARRDWLLRETDCRLLRQVVRPRVDCRRVRLEDEAGRWPVPWLSVRR